METFLLSLPLEGNASKYALGLVEGGIKSVDDLKRDSLSMQELLENGIDNFEDIKTIYFATHVDAAEAAGVTINYRDTHDYSTYYDTEFDDEINETSSLRGKEYYDDDGLGDFTGKSFGESGKEYYDDGEDDYTDKNNEDEFEYEELQRMRDEYARILKEKEDENDYGNDDVYDATQKEYNRLKEQYSKLVNENLSERDEEEEETYEDTLAELEMARVQYNKLMDGMSEANKEDDEAEALLEERQHTKEGLEKMKEEYSKLLESPNTETKKTPHKRLQRTETMDVDAVLGEVFKGHNRPQLKKKPPSFDADGRSLVPIKGKGIEGVTLVEKDRSMVEQLEALKALAERGGTQYGNDLKIEVLEPEGIKGERFLVKITTNMKQFAHLTFNQLQVLRTFNHFEELYKKVQAACNYNLPKFPKKDFLGRFSKSSVEDRIGYFQMLLDHIAKDPGLCQLTCVVDFFDDTKILGISSPRAELKQEGTLSPRKKLAGSLKKMTKKI